MRSSTLFLVLTLDAIGGCSENGRTGPDIDLLTPPDMLAADLSPYPACTGPSPSGDPFNTGKGGLGPHDLAADFTVPTLDGDWKFRRGWSGCDSYFFIFYSSASSYAKSLWGSSVDRLLSVTPPNVHYFFISTEGSGDALMQKLNIVKGHLDDALSSLPAEDQDRWQKRFHFVTKNVSDLNNWIADLVQARGPAAFGIDRFQRVRESGLLFPVTGQGQLPARLEYLTHEARYYNFEWQREQRLGAERAPTVIHVLDGTTMDESVDVEFPDAATMKTFDTMELDLGMWCKDHLEMNCAEWDYIQDLVLCDRDDPTRCPTIIGRFITTYHREGRWVVDVSPLLAHLVEGGKRRLHYNSQYLNSLDIRLYNSGKGGHPSSLVPLWRGEWGFNQDYNKNFMPLQVPVPADATRVQLFAFISGHGFGQDQANCAEFCAHQHRFTVNGTEFLKDFPEAGSATGCIAHIEDGMVPNQYGTWPFGRGGWCPGLEVKPYVVDVTDRVTAGKTATLSYHGTFQGKDYVPVPANNGGFGALIRLQSWLVFWSR